MCLCQTLPPYDPESLVEDFITCSCSRGRGSLVETLPVGTEFGSMVDLAYFQKKAWTSLAIPPSYMMESPTFRVTCDETNNSQQTIDQNQLCVDVEIAPLLSRKYMLKYLYGIEDAAVVYHENRLAEIPAPTNVSEFTSKTCDIQQLAASLSPEAMARVVAAVEATLNELAYDRAMEVVCVD